MTVEERYISESENTKNPDLTKTLLSNDAYAVCDLIEKLSDQIRRSKL